MPGPEQIESANRLTEAEALLALARATETSAEETCELARRLLCMIGVLVRYARADAEEAERRTRQEAEARGDA